MTDKEKIEKVRAEIERRYDKINTLPIGKDEHWEAILGAKAATLHSLLSFIDSMQEEPESHKPKITLGEATGKLKELIDNVSEEGLVIARKQLEELKKECMYSKDNYTDEDRKVLCEGCEEECKYVPPVFDESYWERLCEEPVNDNMEAEFLRAAHNLREQPTLSAWFKHFYNLGKQQDKKWLADNHKRIFNNGYEEGFEAGRDDMEEQMMAKAIDAKCFGFQNAALFSFRLPVKDYLAGSQVKVIVIKED